MGQPPSNASLVLQDSCPTFVLCTLLRHSEATTETVPRLFKVHFYDLHTVIV